VKRDTSPLLKCSSVLLCTQKWTLNLAAIFHIQWWIWFSSDILNCSVYTENVDKVDIVLLGYTFKELHFIQWFASSLTSGVSLK